MNKYLMFLLVFVAVGLIFMGTIFIIAWGIENIAAGGVMLFIALAIILFIYRDSRLEAAKPTLVSQTFNVQMGGSGELREKEMKCKSCGASIGKKDVTVIEGGLSIKCPYCGSTYALEEEPKW